MERTIMETYYVACDYCIASVLFPPEKGVNMDKSKILEQSVKLLESVTKMVSILAIGQRIAEAKSPAEAEYLSRSLGIMLERDFIENHDFENNMNGRQDMNFRM